LLMNDGSPFPARDLAIFLAAGVIILSMLMATIFLPVIAKGMHLPDEETTHKRDEEIARVAAATAAISAVEKAMHDLSTGRSDADLYAGAAARVMGYYRNRVEQSLKTGEDKEQTDQVNRLERKLRLVGLNAEREELFRLGRHRHIPDDLVRRLVREIDMLEARDSDQQS
jgi:monovalent cation/hydrogen antiporter